MRYRGYGTPGLGVVGYIIITCVVVFVATFISPRLISVLEFVPANFSQHPWTVLTSIFVHGSITHILFNMLVLYFFGGFLVSLVGARKFLLVYLLGGLAGNLVFALLASPYGGVVGASGAIFAVEGALVLMRPRLPVFVFPIPAPIPLWGAVIGGFFLSFFASATLPGRPIWAVWSSGCWWACTSSIGKRGASSEAPRTVRA
jgi:membrane associated rhomboid family serine protease